MRTIVGAVLTAAALAGVLVVTHARRLAARVDAVEMRPGDAAGVPSLGDDLPFAPQRVAVVANVRGDDAVLDAAVAEAERVDVVVLLGDVLRQGDDAEARRIAAACSDRGIDVVAVPGSLDRSAAARGAFARWIGPERWWFLRHGCLFVGVPGRGADDDAFVTAAVATAPRGAPVTVFACGAVTGAPANSVVLAPQGAEREPSVAVRAVGDAANGPGEVAWAPVDRGLVAPRSIWRRVALDALAPVVVSTWGYLGLLAACAAVAAFALRRLPAARPAEPRGTACRSAS